MYGMRGSWCDKRWSCGVVLLFATRHMTEPTQQNDSPSLLASWGLARPQEANKNMLGTLPDPKPTSWGSAGLCGALQQGSYRGPMQGHDR